MLPKVVIVGRPNAGKSTLFNKIIGKRRALTHETPYLTRDFMTEEVAWNRVVFELIDTAGIDSTLKNTLNKKIIEMLTRKIEEAEIIIFTVDGMSQITLLDEQIANLIRKMGKEIILVINKVDGPNKLKVNYEYSKFGFKKVMSVSSVHGTGIGDLLDMITDVLKEKGHSEMPEEKEPEPDEERLTKRGTTKTLSRRRRKEIEEEASKKEMASKEKDEKGNEYDPNAAIKIAVVGQPNAGKSSILNAILGYERTLVCEEPGTTRDSIDTNITFENRKITLIDTAGIRKNTSAYDKVEYFSVNRAIATLEKCDVAIIMIDAVKGITFQDKHILDVALTNGKGVVISFNKIDMIKGKDLESVKQDLINYLHNEFPDSAHVPKCFVSAMKNLNVFEPLQTAIRIYEAVVNSKITTSMLNSYITEIISLHPPVSFKGRMLKIYYSTMVAKTPPTFVLFVNNTKLVSSAYERYIKNKLRQAFHFEGYPIRANFKTSMSKASKNQ